jgi:2'-5' RNA ligase
LRGPPTLFLGLELPPALGQALAPLLRQLAAIDPEVRPARAEGLHLTLRFLGPVELEAQAGIELVASRVAQENAAFRLGFQGLGTFPEGTHPRVIWAAVGEGQSEVGRLAEVLAGRLAGEGWRPEPRPFRAHCTLARLPERLSARSRAAVAEFCDRGGAEGPLLMRAETLALLKSVSVPGGPNRYPRLASWRFQQA